MYNGRIVSYTQSEGISVRYSFYLKKQNSPIWSVIINFELVKMSAMKNLLKLMTSLGLMKTDMD